MTDLHQRLCKHSLTLTKQFRYYSLFIQWAPMGSCHFRHEFVPQNKLSLRRTLAKATGPPRWSCPRFRHPHHRKKHRSPGMQIPPLFENKLVFWLTLKQLSLRRRPPLVLLTFHRQSFLELVLRVPSVGTVVESSQHHVCIIHKGVRPNGSIVWFGGDRREGREVRGDERPRRR